jgi:hypothetical protein
MIQALLPVVGELAGSWLKGKTAEKAAKSQVKIAKAEAEAEVMKTAATHDSKWELIMAQSTQTSLKDEIVTVIVLIPVVLVFIPGMEGVVKNGFDRLNELPDWYQYLVFLVCSAALGIKGLDKFRKK